MSLFICALFGAVLQELRGARLDDLGARVGAEHGQGLLANEIGTPDHN